LSRLLDLRNAVATQIKAALPAFEVAGHLGRFSATDLDLFLTKAPAVRVAVLGLTDSAEVDDLSTDYTARLAVFIVTKDGVAKLSRDEAAVAAVETVLLLAKQTRWGLVGAGVFPAKAATAQNLSTEQTLKRGVALWGIEIPQPIRLTAQTEPPADLSELWIGIAPDTGAAHVDDYIGPFPAQGGAGG